MRPANENLQDAKGVFDLFSIFDRCSVADKHQRARQIRSIDGYAGGIQRIKNALNGMTVFVARTAGDGGDFGRYGGQKRRAG